MPVSYRRKWCDHDQKFVLARSEQPWHYRHGLFSLLTFGLWLPVWLVMTLKTDSRFLCPECGRPTMKRPPPRPGKRSAADADAA